MESARNFCFSSEPNMIVPEEHSVELLTKKPLKVISIRKNLTRDGQSQRQEEKETFQNSVSQKSQNSDTQVNIKSLQKVNLSENQLFHSYEKEQDTSDNQSQSTPTFEGRLHSPLETSITSKNLFSFSRDDCPESIEFQQHDSQNVRIRQSSGQQNVSQSFERQISQCSKERLNQSAQQLQDSEEIQIIEEEDLKDNGIESPEKQQKSVKIRRHRTRLCDSQERYKCFCGKYFVSYPGIYIHLKTKHLQQNENRKFSIITLKHKVSGEIIKQVMYKDEKRKNMLRSNQKQVVSVAKQLSAEGSNNRNFISGYQENKSKRKNKQSKPVVVQILDDETQSCYQKPRFKDFLNTQMKQIQRLNSQFQCVSQQRCSQSQPKFSQQNSRKNGITFDTSEQIQKYLKLAEGYKDICKKYMQKQSETIALKEQLRKSQDKILLLQRQNEQLKIHKKFAGFFDSGNHKNFFTASRIQKKEHNLQSGQICFRDCQVLRGQNIYQTPRNFQSKKQEAYQ